MAQPLQNPLERLFFPPSEAGSPPALLLRHDLLRPADQQPLTGDNRTLREYA
jgi:hypothetical protein